MSQDNKYNPQSFGFDQFNSRGKSRGRGGNRGRGRGRGRGNGGGGSRSERTDSLNKSSHHHQRGQSSRPRDKTSHEVFKLRTALNQAANDGNIALTQDLFTQMIAVGDSPTTVTMNILIKAFARGGEPQRGVAVLESMMYSRPDAYGTVANEGTFNAAIAGLAENGNFFGAWQILDLQFKSGFCVQNSFCTIVRNVPSENILPILQSTIKDYGVILDCKLLNTSLVAALEKPDQPNLPHAECIIRFASLMGTKLDSKGCTVVLTAYGKLNQPRDAIQFFENFLAEGSLPDLKLVSCVINLLVTHEPPMMEKAEQMVEKMKAEFCLPIDVVVLNSMIKGYGRVKPPQVEKALEIYASICDSTELQPTAHTFSSVANVLCSVGRAEDAEEVIRAMEKHGIQPIAIHYNVLLKGYSRCRCKLMNGFCKCKICCCSSPERSMELLREMESRGLQVDSVTLHSLIEAFCSAAQIEKARSIVHNVMKNPRNPVALRPTTSVFNMILRGICVKYYIPNSSESAMCGGKKVTIENLDFSKRDQAYEEMNDVLKELQESGLSFDDFTINTKLSILCAFGDIHGAYNFFKSSIPQFQKRSNILFGFNILLNGLDNPYVKIAIEDDFHVKFVEDLLGEMSRAAVDPDTVTLNTIVKALVEKKLLPQAEFYLHKLSREVDGTVHSNFPRVVPNSSTFTSLVNGYLQLGSDADAKRIMLLGETKYNVWLPPSIRSPLMDFSSSAAPLETSPPSAPVFESCH